MCLCGERGWGGAGVNEGDLFKIEQISTCNGLPLDQQGGSQPRAIGAPHPSLTALLFLITHLQKFNLLFCRTEWYSACNAC